MSSPSGASFAAAATLSAVDGLLSVVDFLLPHAATSATSSTRFKFAPYSTITRSLPPRPNVSGMYISSALGGGTTKLPGVVARATYSYVCTPSHSSDANASTRSSRRFWCSYHGPYHHQSAPLSFCAFGSC